MKIKELLTDKSKWTKGAFGRNQFGEPTLRLREAVCFCLSGAVNYCYQGQERWNTIDKILYSIPGYLTIPAFNDAVDFETIKTLVEELDI